MARIFTDDPADIVRFGIPIAKVEEGSDGSVFVWGKATSASLDRDDQIIDPVFAEKSLKDWFDSGANVRVMHSTNLYPAGKGVQLVHADDGEWLKAEISEPTAARLVRKGVLQAYSVGIRRPELAPDVLAKNGRVVGGETVEVSLVDRPANATCGVMIAKMLGGDDTPTVELTYDMLGELPVAEEAPITVKPSDVAALLAKMGKISGAVVAEVEKGELSSGARKELDDSDFAYIDSKGGRHLPVNDEGHIRSALGRFNQTHFESSEAKKKAAHKVIAAAHKHGIDVDDESAVAQAAKVVEADVTKTEDITKTDVADEKVTVGLKELETLVRSIMADQAKDSDATTHSADVLVDEDLRRIAEEAARAVADQAADVATDKVTAPETTKAVEPEPTVKPVFTPIEGSSYALRRLHDVVCAAYDWAGVEQAHPILKSSTLATVVHGAADILRPAVAEAMAPQMLAKGATLAPLAAAFEAAAALSTAADVDIVKARVELAGAFKALYPGAPSLSPLNTGSSGHTPDAKQFCRPLITAGRAKAVAGGEGPRIPPVSHDVEAHDFDRGMLTEGHAADSPQNHDRANPVAGHGHIEPTGTVPGEKAADAELTKTISLLAQLHDGLARVHPHLCPMDMNQPAVAAQIPASTPTEPEVTKGLDPEMVKATVATLVTDQLQHHLAVQAQKFAEETTEIQKRHDAEIAELRNQFNEMAAAPDPRQSIFRSMSGLEQFLPELTKRAQEPPAEAKADRIKAVAGWLNSPDPSKREAARAELHRLMGE